MSQSRLNSAILHSDYLTVADGLALGHLMLELPDFRRSVSWAQGLQGECDGADGPLRAVSAGTFWWHGALSGNSVKQYGSRGPTPGASVDTPHMSQLSALGCEPRTDQHRRTRPAPPVPRQGWESKAAGPTSSGGSGWSGRHTSTHASCCPAPEPHGSTLLPPWPRGHSSPLPHVAVARQQGWALFVPVPWASVTLRAERSPVLPFPPAPGWLIQLPADGHTSHINTVFSFPISPKGSENTCACGTHACTHTIAYVLTCAHTPPVHTMHKHARVHTYPHSCTCHIHMSPCTHILFIKASLSHRLSWGRLGPQTPGHRWR